MTSFSKTETLILGTQNKGKIQELTSLLNPYGIPLKNLEKTTIPDPEETGVTFLDNALLKARYYAKHFDEPVLADDGGLCIEALDQKPGVYTKRFIEELGGFQAFHKKLQELLKNQIDSEKGVWPLASMHCVLVMAWPNGEFKSFHGICSGHIVLPARKGNNPKSFGVDPIFVPQGHDKTFAEDTDYKNKISHRKKALTKFLEYYFPHDA